MAEVSEVNSVYGSKNKVMICLDDGRKFALYRREVNRLGIKEGEPLSEEKYQGLIQTVYIPRARKRAMHLLEKMDRTEEGLRRKLFLSGYPEEAVEDAISYVRSYHYIDDRRYAREFVRLHEASRSRKRIRTDLMQRGVPEDIIEEVLSEGPGVDQVEVIKGILTKRHYDPKDADPRTRARTIRFLLSKGFTYEEIKAGLGD